MPKADYVFLGRINFIRFVQLVDGRKIMQYSRDGQIWETPDTIDVRTLDEAEKSEIIEALKTS